MRLLLLIGFCLIVQTSCQYDGENNRIDAAETYAKAPANKISGDANELKAQESVEGDDVDGPPTYARPETAPGIPDEGSNSEESKDSVKTAAKPTKAPDAAVTKSVVSEAVPPTHKKSLSSRYPIPPTEDSLEDSPLEELNRGVNSDVKSIVVASPSAPTSTELKNTPVRPYSNEVSTEGSGSSESSESTSSSSSSSESVEEGSGSEVKAHEHEPSPPEYVRPSNAPGVPKAENVSSLFLQSSTNDSKTSQTLVPSNPVAVEKGMEVKPVMRPPNPPNMEMMKILKGILGSMGEIEDITMPDKTKNKNQVDSKTGASNHKQQPALSMVQSSEKPILKQTNQVAKPVSSMEQKVAKPSVSSMAKDKANSVGPSSATKSTKDVTPRISIASVNPLSTPSPVRTTHSTNKPSITNVSVSPRTTIAPVTTTKAMPIMKVKPSFEDITMPEKPKPKTLPKSKPTEQVTKAPRQPEKLNISSPVPKSKPKDTIDDFSPAQILRMANAMAALEAMQMFKKPSLTSTSEILDANGMPLTGTGMSVRLPPKKLNIPTQNSGYSSKPGLKASIEQTPEAAQTSIVATDYSPGATASLPNPKETPIEPDDRSGEQVSVGEGEDMPEQPEDDRLHFIKPDRVDEDIPPVPKDPAKSIKNTETFTAAPKIATKEESKIPVSKGIQSESVKPAEASLTQAKPSNFGASSNLGTYLTGPRLPSSQKLAPQLQKSEDLHQVPMFMHSPTTSNPPVKKFEGMKAFPRYMMPLPTSPKRVVVNQESGEKATPTGQTAATTPTTAVTRAPVGVPNKLISDNWQALLVMSKSGMAKMRLMSLAEQSKAATTDNTSKSNVPQTVKVNMGIRNYESLPSDPPVSTKKQPTSTFVGMTYVGPKLVSRQATPTGRKDLPQPHDRLVKELWLEKIIGRGGITPRPGMKDEFVTAPDEMHSSPGVTLRPEHSKLVTVQTAEEVKQAEKNKVSTLVALPEVKEIKGAHLTEKDQKELEKLLKVLAIEKVDMDVINSKLFRKAKKIANNSRTTEAPAYGEEAIQVEGSGESEPTSESPVTKSEDSTTSNATIKEEQPHLGASAYDETSQLLEQVQIDNSTEIPSHAVESTTMEVVTTNMDALLMTNSTEANVLSSVVYDVDSILPSISVPVQRENSTSPAPEVPEVSVDVESSGEEPKSHEVSSTIASTVESRVSFSETSPSPPEPTPEPQGIPQIKEPGYEPEPPSVQPDAAAEIEASGEASEERTTVATLTESSTILPITDLTTFELNVTTTAGYGEEALAEVLVNPDEENRQTVQVAEIVSTELPVTSSQTPSTTPEASTKPALESTTTLENIQTTEVIEPESESMAIFSESPALEQSSTLETTTVALVEPETTTTPAEVTESSSTAENTIQSESTPTSVSEESTIAPVILSTDSTSTIPGSYSDADEITTTPEAAATKASTTLTTSTPESIEPSGYEVAQQGDLDNIQYLTPDVEPIQAEAAVGYAGISNEEKKAEEPPKKDSFIISNGVEHIEKNTESTPVTTTLNANRRWTPYMFDCTKEIDEKGALCKEWAEGGLCEINKPTMFLFCRRTCLCTGPQ